MITGSFLRGRISNIRFHLCCCLRITRVRPQPWFIIVPLILTTKTKQVSMFPLNISLPRRGAFINSPICTDYRGFSLVFSSTDILSGGYLFAKEFTDKKIIKA